MSTKKSRRQFLKESLALGAGLLLSDRALAAIADAATGPTPGGKKTVGQGSRAASPRFGKAKSVIYISLDGGASQTDTFDPKPGLGRDYVGPYQSPITTNVPGMMLGQRLVELSKIADRFALIRSMHISTNAHETAHYRMLSGDMTGGSIVYPSFGAMISYLKESEYKNSLPPYITLTESSTRFSESGFLPPKYKPYDTGGSPASSYFDVNGIVDHNKPDSVLRKNRALLDQLGSLGRPVEATAEIAQAAGMRTDNYDLILGDVRKVFDLSSEPKTLRDQYGMNNFGQSCLAARKLAQAGVLVTVVRFRGWDTHKEHFARMDQRLMEFDKGVSSLILDLERLGMLDQTIVLCGGEFGRRPRIDWGPPWNGGRGHWGDAFSYLVAGGGFRGGRVVGQTDEKSEQVVERKVFPADLIGTMYTLMGIDPHSTVKHPTEGDIPILPSLGTAKGSNGLLDELLA